MHEGPLGAKATNRQMVRKAGKGPSPSSGLNTMLAATNVLHQMWYYSQLPDSSTVYMHFLASVV